MARTLGDRFSGRDAERFVGRASELAVFETLFVDDPPASVVHVHGPGGIGKSALLRQVERLGAERGWSPWRIDGRELAPVPGELETIVAAARGEARPLLLFDTYERISALDGALRTRLLPALPEGAMVVLAGRERPGAEWFQDGWEHVVRALHLTPLSAVEGRALVAAHGIADEDTTAALVDWSDGSPLALTLAIAIAARDGRWDAAGLDAHPQLLETLVDRLVPDREAGYDDVAAVAAIARVTTASMLADVLPGVEPTEGAAWLRALAVAEPVGDGVAMHDLVRRALRARLRTQRPQRERELRRGVADHLLAHAVNGEPRLIVDLAELIEDPALRWGFGAEAAGGLHADDLRPEELDAPAQQFRGRAGEPWWSATRALATAAPEHVVAARDHHDVLCGLAISCTPQGASDAALADPYLGPWVRHAREHIPDGDVLVWRDALDLTTSEAGDLGSRVLAVVNTAAILRSGLANPRYFYLPINPVNTASLAFAQRSGAEYVPGLDLRVGSVVHECHVIDHGPAGVLGALRATIYGELGLPRPAAALSGASRAPSAAVTDEDVRQALRDLDRPTSLATSPLVRLVTAGADGENGRDPAGAVRALLERAMTDAFGVGRDEELLRSIALHAYADHDTTHEEAAHALHVSRATYFRRLRQATERVCDHVLAVATVRARAAA
ncbi:MAG: hypothetical protein QOK49_3862 [Baekduia sp.]|jgi:hypothetical protein|nr:hypothetical protein [Baekduia sp.]